MASEEHLNIQWQGSDVWNKWRQGHPDVKPDLSDADLSMATARRVAQSSAITLWGMGGDVRDLSGYDLHDADLRRSNLSGQILTGVNLVGADLTGADLTHAHLVGVDLRKARLNDCRVYGTSSWDVLASEAEQANLVITPDDEPPITVDNLEVAQFLYLLLRNEKIRNVIDTITSKVVLILGRFTPERKAILDALRDTLRQRNYLPVVFDFDKPASRDLTETVRTLAHLARFIIADITDPRSIPQELQAIVPDLAVPVQPIIARPQKPWGMFVDFPKKYHWVLEAHEYTDLSDLLSVLQTNVIAPAEAKAKQLAAR
jgi:hypothetical protein